MRFFNKNISNKNENSVYVNGKKIISSGGNVSVINGRIFVDGKEINYEKTQANKVKTLDRLVNVVMDKNYNIIKEIDGIGDIMIDQLKKHAQSNFLELYNYVVPTDIVETVAVERSKEDILTFVVTGKFDIPRKEIEQMIKEAGHKTAGSVSAKTTYLLASLGEEGTSKYLKAKEIGTRIINTVEELREIINE